MDLRPVIALKATAESALKERKRVNDDREEVLAELRRVRAEWQATLDEVRRQRPRGEGR